MHRVHRIVAMPCVNFDPFVHNDRDAHYICVVYILVIDSTCWKEEKWQNVYKKIMRSGWVEKIKKIGATGDFETLLHFTPHWPTIIVECSLLLSIMNFVCICFVTNVVKCFYSQYWINCSSTQIPLATSLYSEFIVFALPPKSGISNTPR